MKINCSASFGINIGHTVPKIIWFSQKTELLRFEQIGQMCSITYHIRVCDQKPDIRCCIHSMAVAGLAWMRIFRLFLGQLFEWGGGRSTAIWESIYSIYLYIQSIYSCSKGRTHSSIEINDESRPDSISIQSLSPGERRRGVAEGGFIKQAGLYIHSVPLVRGRGGEGWRGRGGL